jgi:hypothetical protein
MKKLIICGPPRSGTTALCELINKSTKAFVSNELYTFHPNETLWLNRIDKIKPETLSALQNKNWNVNQLKEMIISNTYPPELEIFGDKLPAYCLDNHAAKYIVSKYGEKVYFIFTTRKIHGIVNSFFKRTKIEKDESAIWFTNDTVTALQRITKYYDNLLFMYPKIKNKIIVNYDDAMRDQNYISNKLENFLGIQIDKNHYKNDQFDDWKIDLNEEQKNIIDIFLNNYKDLNTIIPF